jgi:CDP-diacylglycerol--glycerol-3-phosphate 3-phosphatidyltransferase
MSKQDILPGPHLKISDDFLSHTLLRLIPYSVSPNMVTLFRFVCVPVVITLLLLHSYIWGTILFALGVLSDALDGAMARTRHQITHWGKVADPLADKLLIISTTLILATRYIGWWTVMLLVGIELILVLRALYRHAHGLPSGANAMGKIKMVLQSVALLILFVYVLSGTAFFLPLATGSIYIAIFFAFLSLLSAPAA